MVRYRYQTHCSKASLKFHSHLYSTAHPAGAVLTNEAYWQTLRSEDYSSVQGTFHSLSQNERMQLTRYIPAVPTPRVIENSQDQIDPEEYGTLRYFASVYPSRYKEPDFSKWEYAHPAECRMIWQLALKELEEHINLYIQYILLAKAEAGMAMSADARKFVSDVKKAYGDAGKSKKNADPRYLKKDRYMHV